MMYASFIDVTGYIIDSCSGQTKTTKHVFSNAKSTATCLSRHNVPVTQDNPQTGRHFLLNIENSENCT